MYTYYKQGFSVGFPPGTATINNGSAPILSKTTTTNHKYLTVNLSNLILDTPTYELLEKGLSFVPKPNTIKLNEIITNQNKLIRDMKLKSIQKQDKKHKQIRKLIEPSKWVPPDYLLSKQTLDLVDAIKFKTSTLVDNIARKSSISRNTNYNIQNTTHTYNWIINNRDKSNLTKEEKACITRLKNNQNIIIKPADKGGATVIMNKVDYKSEAERQLNNNKYYKEITVGLAESNKSKIEEILRSILNKKYINQSQFNYLNGPSEYNLRKFYLLPKIHKPPSKWPSPNMPEGRPIVSDTESESARSAEFIDSIINPMALDNPYIIKNTYEFIDKIRNTHFPKGYLLVTGDIKSLYTNMNIHRTIEVVKQTLDLYPDTKRPDKEILDLLELTLFNNDFKFGNKQYLQIHGTAMGKKYAPALANLYLKSFDNSAQQDFHIHPEWYFRFLDDVFFIWGGGVDNLVKFQKFLNNLIPDIEITLEYSEIQMPFLDTMLYINDNKIQTRTYFKETDTHQLLHTSSYHPKHTTLGILKSQFIRFKRLSSTYNDYINTCHILFSYLQNRGYTASNFRKLMYNVWYQYNTTKEVASNNNKDNKLLPIIMPFSQLGNKLSTEYKKIIKESNLFPDHKLISAYTISPNLKKLLVRTEFSTGNKTIHKPLKGYFYRCTSTNCVTCRFYTSDTNTFTSSANKQTFTIENKVSCTTQNIIYLITCKKCHIQYVGETSRSLKDRLYNHISCIKNKIDNPIGSHFNLHNHNTRDISILTIEKINDTSILTRKHREMYWIGKLQTMQPLGLNF